MTARRYPAGIVVLEPRDAAILWQVGQLEAVRGALRGRDEEAYEVFRTVYESQLLWRDAVEGKKALADREKPQARSRWLTPAEIAKERGVNPRTVRNDIARGILPAVKRGRIWTVELASAATYLAARKPL